MRESFKEYITSLGHWGWVVLVDIISGAVGAYLDISGKWGFPTWLWIMLLMLGLAIAPFLAFHKLRVYKQELETKLNDRQERLNVRCKLDDLIGKGNRILSRLTAESEESLDKYDKQIDDWAYAVKDILRGTGYENYWESNIGLVKVEDEKQDDFIRECLVVDRNYMRCRILRLQEIKGKLGD